MTTYLTYVVVLLLLISSFSLSACRAERGTARAILVEETAMPAPVRRAPQRVRDAYRFAAANPEVLAQIPCYCGCGPMGHGSNYACFWREDGSLDEHGLGCGICVDIAQDVMRGLEQGRSLAEMWAQVDADYSRFGPSTNTPPVGRIRE